MVKTPGVPFGHPKRAVKTPLSIELFRDTSPFLLSRSMKEDGRRRGREGTGAGARERGTVGLPGGVAPKARRVELDLGPRAQRPPECRGGSRLCRARPPPRRAQASGGPAGVRGRAGASKGRKGQTCRGRAGGGRRARSGKDPRRRRR